MEKAKKVLCYYHSADIDGMCSAALIKVIFEGAYDDGPFDLVFKGANYEQGRDYWAEIEAEGELAAVVIVDYSLPVETVRRILHEGIRVIWYDHHKTAIERFFEDRTSPFYGRGNDGTEMNAIIWPDKDQSPTMFLSLVSTRKSAAGLIAETIEKLHKPLLEKNPNLLCIANLTSVYDTWDKKNFLWRQAEDLNAGMKFRCFEEGFTAFNTIFQFKDLFCEAMTTGHAINAHERVMREKTAFSLGGLLTWRGVKFLAVNTQSNSAIADNKVKRQDFEAVLTYYYSPKAKAWKVSLYGCSNSSPMLDLSGIAKSFGGGGHAQACGFSTPALPFNMEDIRPLAELED